jgi:hypothetical protein
VSLANDWPYLLVALALGALLASLLMMRFLVTPRVGCWLFYVATLIGTFAVVVAGLLLLGLAALIKDQFKETGTPDVGTYIISGVVLAAMWLGKQFLKARNTRPFQAVMRWCLRRWFTTKVGATLPTKAPDHPHRLAFRAVFDDAFADPRYGSVEGWGVRACCKRLLAIRNR